MPNPNWYIYNEISTPKPKGILWKNRKVLQARWPQCLLWASIFRYDRKATPRKFQKHDYLNMTFIMTIPVDTAAWMEEISTPWWRVIGNGCWERIIFLQRWALIIGYLIPSGPPKTHVHTCTSIHIYATTVIKEEVWTWEGADGRSRKGRNDVI